LGFGRVHRLGARHRWPARPNGATRLVPGLRPGRGADRRGGILPPPRRRSPRAALG
jgi:hypothetical protein